MPEMMGAGLSYTFDNRLTLATDYSLTKWGDAVYMGVRDTLNNQSKISFGAEYQPNARGRYYYEKDLLQSRFKPERSVLQNRWNSATQKLWHNFWI